MITAISGGRIITPENEIEDHTILIENEVIREITTDYQIGEYDERINANGLLITPGFFDIHIHGALGQSFANAIESELIEITRFLYSHGVTSTLATILSHSSHEIRAISSKILATLSDSILGLHIEGPYINPKYPGGISLTEIRQPDSDDYLEWLECESIKLITVAPELPGSLRFIRDCQEKGIICSIGHSSASFEQVDAAVKAGANQVTHLFNCMGGFHHRDPGIIGYSLLSDKLFVQLICEPELINPKVIRLLSRIKNAEKIILISDAEVETGLGERIHHLNGAEVHIKEGKSYKPDGSFSGSTILLDQAIRNMHEITGLKIKDIIHMATTAPAKSLGIYPHKGSLQAGADADIVFLDDDFQVVRTMVAGKTVFLSE